MKLSQAGFTLIEALVAFAIMAVVLVTLYQAAGTGLKAFDAAAATEDAILVAQSQMDRIVALRRIPEVRQGTVPGSAFHWKLQVLPPPALPSANQLATSPVLLRVTVAWNTSRGGKSVYLERLVFVAGQGR